MELSASMLMISCLLLVSSQVIRAGLSMEEMESMMRQMHGKDYKEKNQEEMEERKNKMTVEEKREQERKDEAHKRKVQETVSKFQEDQKRGKNPDIGKLLGTLTGGLMGPTDKGEGAGGEGIQFTSTPIPDDKDQVPKKGKRPKKIDLSEDLVDEL